MCESIIVDLEENGNQNFVKLYLENGETLITPKHPTEESLLNTFSYLEKSDKEQCLLYLFELRLAEVDILLPPIIDFIIKAAEGRFKVMINLLKLPERGLNNILKISGDLGAGFPNTEDYDCEDTEDAASWIANFTGYRVKIVDVAEQNFSQIESPNESEFFHFFAEYL